MGKVEEHLKEGCLTLDLAFKETANALVKRVLKGEVDVETAREILDCLPGTVRVTSQREHFSKALEIAVENRMTIYDALFIALSVDAKMPLVTSDKKAKTSREYGVSVTLI